MTDALDPVLVEAFAAMAEKSARGKRSRRSGLRYQREVRKKLEAIFGVKAADNVMLGGAEEGWTNLPVRVEVKSGQQMSSIVNHYCRMREQNDRNLPNDVRPFLGIVVLPRNPAIVLVSLVELAELLRK